MAKPPKQFHEGYWYHVYARSLEGVRLFASDEERDWFVVQLDEVFTRRRVSLGALCLMDTHYHALVRMGPVRLDRALNGLHMSYAKHVNHERGRRGSLFEKHPGTDIVLDDSYLLQLVPYVHRNPMEAGIVEDPREYAWHTDSLYRGEEWEKGPISCWEWPPYFQGEDRSRTYRERMGEEEDILRKREGYIGTEGEWKKLEKREDQRADRHRDRRDRASMDSIASRLADSNGTSVEDLKKPGRSQPETRIRQRAMVRMYEEGYGPKEIGDYFNRDKGTVAYAIRTHD